MVADSDITQNARLNGLHTHVPSLAARNLAQRGHEVCPFNSFRDYVLTVYIDAGITVFHTGISTNTVPLSITTISRSCSL
jgi:hypothetical protein